MNDLGPGLSHLWEVLGEDAMVAWDRDVAPLLPTAEDMWATLHSSGAVTVVRGRLVECEVVAWWEPRARTWVLPAHLSGVDDQSVRGMTCPYYELTISH